jgi:hypothetical protein
VSWIILTPKDPIEATRWTVVFHRKAENRFFSLIAMGHFKHVSAFAWLPELGIWTFYDVGFRRTKIVHMADGVAAQATVAAIVEGNCLVTIAPRMDGLPLFRWGLFCTTAVAHLLGMRCHTLRPDALFRHLKAHGGIIRDDAARKAPDRGRPEPAGPASAGAGNLGHEPAGGSAG